MKKVRKPEPDNTDKIKVLVKNRPASEQAGLILKQLGEILSNNWQDKDNNPPD